MKVRVLMLWRLLSLDPAYCTHCGCRLDSRTRIRSKPDLRSVRFEKQEELPNRVIRPGIEGVHRHRENTAAENLTGEKKNNDYFIFKSKKSRGGILGFGV